MSKSIKITVEITPKTVYNSWSEEMPFAGKLPDDLELLEWLVKAFKSCPGNCELVGGLEKSKQQVVGYD